LFQTTADTSTEATENGAGGFKGLSDTKAGHNPNNMGNTDSKLNFRKAIVQLTQKNQKIDPSDEPFWEQFWQGHQTTLERC